MTELYDVYFAGQVQEGEDPARVRANLGKLFNANEQTLDKMFSGKPSTIKRDCDRETALKYKTAMERAGAVPVIRAQQGDAGDTTPNSAAEKIAALAAAPDEIGHQQESAPAAAVDESPENEDGIGLAPPGTEVLRESERAAPVIREVDTSALHVDTSAQRLSEESSPPPLNLDTSHLSMAEAGEAIPNLPSTDTPLSPDTSAISLSEPGTDFSDCATPEPPPPELDLSNMSTEPPGSDILEEQYRKKDTGETPSTDHLSLGD